MLVEGAFLGGLPPKFYVALTGTSSLISGLILIFEWWYFRKYGTSFIEQVSLAHLHSWWGGAARGAAGEGGGGGGGAGAGECLVWRNPMALLRGAEYARLWTSARRAPLTYYDMNLTAQEHQAWFGGVGDGPAEEALGRAWREREPRARVAAAREALRHAPDCAAALLLLAEEDAPTVLEAERVLRRAWRAAEASLRGPAAGAVRARDAAVLAHVKRRAAACQRRLGRLRSAARAFRNLAREPGGCGAGAGGGGAPPHENLLEVLLEQRLYPDCAAHLARLDERGAPATAARAYTGALLRARAAALAPESEAERAAAAAALAEALACNACVPEYLLELRALALPPEHVVRGGRSEALAYAFFHLRHWKSCPPALRLLEEAWRAAGRGAGGVGRGEEGAGAGCAACVDRELVASGGGGGGAGAAAGPRAGRGALLLPLAALWCAGVGVALLAAWRWPSRAAALVRAAARRADPRSQLQALARLAERAAQPPAPPATTATDA